jgi:outer membrane translocation and assembly module TamA
MGSTTVEGELFTPLPMSIAGSNTTLVFKAGGRHVWGHGFPADELAFIGGSNSLRGYRFSRFAGRSSLHGSAEIRIPLFELELFTRGRIGVLGFQDVGRVWWDDEDSNQWHRGHGGGIWYESLGFWMSVSAARGEETRIYLDFSSPM